MAICIEFVYALPIQEMSVVVEHGMSDYLNYRGKCKEYSTELCTKDSTLTLVRGYYYCPIWNTKEPHWWCENLNGDIIDPTKEQFPSKGLGEYEKFNGLVECAECGKLMKEEDAKYESRYAFCRNTNCYGKFVGIV